MYVAAVDPELLRNFAIALFIGALVGIDRERKLAALPAFGGLRTFMLIALAGATAAWLGQRLGTPWLVGVGLVVLGGLLGAAYFGTTAEERHGLTGEVAGVVVYLLGAVSVAGAPELAVVLGIATSALSAFKEPLHRLVGQIGEDDLAAGLKLLFATFIVLPLLPNRPIDPLGALNLYRLWWLVVLISTLSLLGYVAVRWLGERRGTVLTGVFGGLVSSTAVTLSAARRSRDEAASPDALASGILIAWTVSFVRVLIDVLVVQPSLLRPLLAPALVMGGVAGLGALGFAWRPAPQPEPVGPDVELRNPFSLWEATKFGLLFATVRILVALAQRYLPPDAIHAVAALAATTGLDAITLSVADPTNGLAADVATFAIVVAMASNTLARGGIALALGAGPLARRIGIATLAICVAGLATVILT